MRARRYDLVVASNGWARFGGRRMPCALGRKGVVEAKREGDGATPAGVFRLEQVFWRPDRLPPPPGVLPTKPIRIWDGWSDDPRDPRYNRAIRRPCAFTHERLRRPDRLYNMLAVFDINRDPIEPGAGSALFLHVWRRPRYPTAGCVAFSQVDLLWILRNWTPRSRLQIQNRRAAKQVET